MFLIKIFCFATPGSANIPRLSENTEIWLSGDDT